MEQATSSADSEIRTLLERWSDAARTKDIDRLMSLYSPDIVYFDVVPPLRFIGSADVRSNFVRWFDGFEGPIGAEIHEPHILASGNVAVAYMPIRASGTLKDGREVAYWARATVCCKRANRGWLITHEHISLPFDVERGTLALDLAP